MSTHNIKFQIKEKFLQHLVSGAVLGTQKQVISRSKRTIRDRVIEVRLS